MMKKFFVIITVLLMFCSMITACGNHTKNTNDVINEDAVHTTEDAKSDIDETIPSPTIEPEDEQNKIAYTKGTFDGKTYVNEWANIKFELPDGYKNADESVYSKLDSFTIDCGAYYIASDLSAQFTLCFKYVMPSYEDYDEVSFLDYMLESYRASPDTCEISEYTEILIAGEKYTTVKCDDRSDDPKILNMCTRKIGDHIIFLSIASSDNETAETLFKQITPAK